MKIVLIGKQKGGVGATTCTRELAVAGAAAGRTVAMVDLDPQHTLSRWWSRRQTARSEEQPNPALIGAEVAAVPAALGRLGEAGVDLVLIDTPPSIHPYVLELAKRADLVLAPVRPTTDDLDALRGFLDALDPTVPFAFVITQCQARSRLYDDALRLLAERGRVGPPLRYRSDYAAAPGEGRAAYEIRGSKAAEEVAELWRWLDTTLAAAPASKDARTPGRKRTRTT